MIRSLTLAGPDHRFYRMLTGYHAALPGDGVLVKGEAAGDYPICRFHLF
ncbi:MAG: hypothetical protein U5R30_10320 [Deltaproteobacteria bacterium]|nr:hypothetical protein [Deltaproteobacteria bacterium]